MTALIETQGIKPPDKSLPRPILRLLARSGDGLHRLSGDRLRGPVSLQGYATSAVEITLDMSKAQQELGYSPIVRFEEGSKRARARNR